MKGKKTWGVLLIPFLLMMGLPSIGKSQTKDTLTVMFYNLLNFPTATTTPNRQDTLRKILGYVKPDIFIACEINNITGANLVLNNSLNAWGRTNYSMSTFIPNQSTADDLQQMCYYNNSLLGLRRQGVITTDLRDVNEFILYYKDPNLPLTADTTWLDLYCTHLKAGNTSTDATRRNTEATAFRNYMNTKPPGRNNIFGADFNVYTSAEASYQTLTATGTYPFVDPIARPGAWNNTASFASIHTQSTRLLAFNGGATGGLDDRFDQILVTNNVLSGTNRVRYIPGTYKALGNDGQHFNLALIDPPLITIIPDSVRRALYHMSDHLPVVMQIEITLPVPLASSIDMFAADLIEDRVGVSWMVQPDHGTWVQVERSVDGGEFNPVSPLLPSEDGIWVDPSPTKGINYYRLKMSNGDGKSAFSEVRQVNYQSEFTLYFQNPARDVLPFHFASDKPIIPVVNLIDMTGRNVMTWRGEISNQGSDGMDLSGMGQGIYLIMLTDHLTGEQSKPAKVIVQ